jgi:hypothetical protein
MNIIDMEFSCAILNQDLNTHYGIDLEADMQWMVREEILKVRDQHKLDLTDDHIRAEVVIQMMEFMKTHKRPYTDKFRVTINKTTTQLRNDFKDFPIEVLWVYFIQQDKTA